MNNKTIIIYYVFLYVIIQVIQFTITGKMKIFSYLNDATPMIILSTLFLNSLFEQQTKKNAIIFTLFIFILIIYQTYYYYSYIKK